LWVASLPKSVLDCFYQSAMANVETKNAFAHCQQTDGGEKCIKEISAGVKCLNDNKNDKDPHFTSSGRYYYGGYGYGYPF
jgi:hypothetical protein